MAGGEDLPCVMREAAGQLGIALPGERVCEMHMPRLMHFLFAHDLLGAHSDVEVSRWVYGSW